jgi:2-keto-4-pentenoate hydratase/2-oxohepta-3-ene-1,7-dioic acid hydratase in catechol pathway
MRYCKYLSFEQLNPIPRYAFVELRDNVLWAVAPMATPEEDLPLLLQERSAPPQAPFPSTPVSDLHLLTPVTPSKILCVGRNYRDHATELGNDIPKEPLLFLKPPSSLLAPGGTIRIPALSQRVDYEGELAIVIGKRCRNLSADEDVRPYIRGYTLVNDVTARDVQKSDGQWTRGKGFDTFCPTGPVVSNEIDPAGGDPVTLITRLNGEIKQQGSTADLIFSIPFLLRYISATMTLEPGDLISTGTPAGVGCLQPGDKIQVSIEGLGMLENTVAPEA